MSDGAGSFQEKLNALIESHRHPSGRTYTDREIAAGANCSHELVRQLRTGARDNPSLRIIQGLANFFGVPASSLVDAEADTPDPALSAALKNADVAYLATRASELSPDARKTVLAVVEQIRSLEHPNG